MFTLEAATVSLDLQPETLLPSASRTRAPLSEKAGSSLLFPGRLLSQTSSFRLATSPIKS